MSPRLRIDSRDRKKPLVDAEFSDEVGTVFDGEDGIRAIVIAEGQVRMRSNYLHGAYDLVSATRVTRREGLTLDFAAGDRRELLVEGPVEMSSVTVTAEPSGHGGPERF